MWLGSEHDKPFRVVKDPLELSVLLFLLAFYRLGALAASSVTLPAHHLQTLLRALVRPVPLAEKALYLIPVSFWEVV